MGRNRVWGLLLVVLSCVVVTLSGIGDELCYNDVIIHGSGAWWANGCVEFSEMDDGRPVFRSFTSSGNFPGECLLELTVAFDGRWLLAADLECPYSRCWALYGNDSPAVTPPPTGWYLLASFGYGGGGCEFLPAPTLSGGGPCVSEGTLVPAGLAGFLDRGWPEGAVPPVAGELVVSAAYEAGELAMGCCAVVDENEHLVEVAYVTITWYAVTIGEGFFDAREPLDARLLYEADGRFCFTVPTDGFEPGYYDIRLGVPFMDEQWIRVQVMAPSSP